MRSTVSCQAEIVSTASSLTVMRVWTNSRAGALGLCMSSLPIKALISHGQARGLEPSSLSVTAASVLY